MGITTGWHIGLSNIFRISSHSSLAILIYTTQISRFKWLKSLLKYLLWVNVLLPKIWWKQGKSYENYSRMISLVSYSGFSPKPPGGGVFFYTSLKLKTQIVEFGFYRLLIKKVAKTKSQAKTCKNPKGVGFLFLLAFSLIAEKKPHPLGVLARNHCTYSHFWTKISHWDLEL